MTSAWKILTTWAALLSGAWIAMIGIVWAWGLEGFLWVAGAIAFALAVMWAIDVKRHADLELSRRAREADITRRENINRTQVSNGKRGTA